MSLLSPPPHKTLSSCMQIHTKPIRVKQLNNKKKVWFLQWTPPTNKLIICIKCLVGTPPLNAQYHQYGARTIGPSFYQSKSQLLTPIIIILIDIKHQEDFC